MRVSESWRSVINLSSDKFFKFRQCPASHELCHFLELTSQSSLISLPQKQWEAPWWSCPTSSGSAWPWTFELSLSYWELLSPNRQMAGPFFPIKLELKCYTLMESFPIRVNLYPVPFQTIPPSCLSVYASIFTISYFCIYILLLFISYSYGDCMYTSVPRFPLWVISGTWNPQ